MNHAIIFVDKHYINPREYKSLIKNDISMFELSKDKQNTVDQNDCQNITIFLTHIGQRKIDEIDKSKDIVKIKYSIINSFNDKLSGDKVL